MLRLFTDTDTDITPALAKEYGFTLISMPYAIEGKTVYPYEDFDTFDDHAFYERLRSGLLYTLNRLADEGHCYATRDQLIRAGAEIPEENRSDVLTEETLCEHMNTNFMPDPDLLIRTGGELRISNFLLWQIAYSELYFCDTFWPDFMEEDLHKAIASYQQRQRRYGKTEAQVENEE